MQNNDFIKLHIFTAKNASASIHEGRQNVGRVSFSVGEKENEECFVFVLTRSDLEVLAGQIQQLFEPAPKPPRRRKAR